MGHAMAVTGNKPSHLNNLESFLERGEDTFGFYDQFKNWSDKNMNCEYERVLVKFDSLWENLDYLFGYMGIPKTESRFFLRKQERVNRTHWWSNPEAMHSSMHSFFKAAPVSQDCGTSYGTAECSCLT